MNFVVFFSIAIIAFFIGYMLAKYNAEKNFAEIIKKEKTKSARYLFDMSIDLLMIARFVSGVEFDKMLRVHNYKRVAIYGAANVGKCLYHFLAFSEIGVACFIDKKKFGELLYNIPICDLDNIDSNIDAIIVTPLTYFDEIYDELKTKIDCPIIPITDIFGDE